VRWFSIQKGYGYITPYNGNKDVLVHISSLQSSGINSLNESDKVSYNETRKNGRISAGNIKLITE